MSAAGCFCGPSEYFNCWDLSCQNAGSGAVDEPETDRCEACGKKVLVETLVQHTDVNLCTECDAQFQEAFARCNHEWVEYYGEWETGQACARCGAFVGHSVAVDLFPMICDGWIPEPVA